MLDNITVIILTFNEQNNIDRVLSKLYWAKDIVVVDSFSNDDTLEILSNHEHVRVFNKKFESHAIQWNFAINETGIKTKWILALDADYVLSDDLITEISSMDASSSTTSGFSVSFKYLVFGKELKGSIYPPVTVLYKKESAKYVQDGHTQRINVDGDIVSLGSVIYHDDRKPLERWLKSQDNYMKLESDYIHNTGWNQLRMVDKLRKLIFLAPPIVFIYCLIVKRGLLSGKSGLHYAMQRTLAETLLSIRLLEKKLT